MARKQTRNVLNGRTNCLAVDKTGPWAEKLSPDDETVFPTRAGVPQSKHPMVADIWK